MIAIIGILSAAILVAINPGKRLAQARDAQRKTDIGVISHALVGYYTLIGNYPPETRCDSSGGPDFDSPCPPNPALIPPLNWATGVNGRIYDALITQQQFLKKMPKDPKNDTTYYYAYEPRESTDDWCVLAQCSYYWIGTLLESPADPLKPIFRCSDLPVALLAEGAGCKEVSDQLNDETPDDCNVILIPTCTEI